MSAPVLKSLPGLCRPVPRCVPLAAVGALLLALAATPALAGDADGLAKARAAWEAGDTRAAVLRIKEALQLNPDDAAARLLLARTALDIGDTRAAEQEARRAMEAGADPAEALPVLAEALLAQGRFAEVVSDLHPPADAGEDLRAALLAAQGKAELGLEDPDAAAARFAEALQLVPGQLEAAAGLAQVQALRGELDEARRALRTLAEQNMQSELVWAALGRLEAATGHPVEAANAYTRAIDQARADGLLRYQRALAYADANDLEAVRNDLAALAEQMPAWPGNHYLRGWVALRDGQVPAALEALETWLKAAPDDPRGIYFAALALYQERRHAQAEEYLVRLQQRMPGNPMVATLMGLNRLANNDPAGAVEVLAPFETAPEAPAEALDVLRRALLESGREADSVRVLERIQAAHPELVGAQLMLAGYRQQQGDPAAAEPLLRAVLAREPDHEAANQMLLRGLLQAGDTDAALALTNGLTARAPDSPFALTMHGAALAARGDLAGAQQAFGEALARDPGYARAALGLAALALGKGETGTARGALDALLAADPTNAQGWLALAGLDAREAGPEALVKRLREAVQTNPQDLGLRLSAVQTLVQREQAAAALELLSQVPADQATRPGVLLLSAQAEAMAGNLAGATVLLKQLADANPNTPQVYYLLAMLSLRGGNAVEAEAQFIAGLERDRSDALGAAQIDALLKSKGDPGARRALLERLLKVAPEHYQLRVAMARYLLSIGDAPAALAAFEALARERPEQAEVAVGIAAALRGSGRVPEALKQLDGWLEGHPQDVPGRLLRAEIALDQGRAPDAIADYRAVLAVSPDQPTALNNLAMLIAERTPGEALPLAERGAALRPKDPMFLDTLGFVLLQLNEPARAREVLAQAHGATPDPGVALNYARALAATGDRAQARSVLLAIVNTPFAAQQQAAELLKTLGQ